MQCTACWIFSEKQRDPFMITSGRWVTLTTLCTVPTHIRGKLYDLYVKKILKKCLAGTGPLSSLVPLFNDEIVGSTLIILFNNQSNFFF